MKLTEVTEDRVVLYDAERHCMRVGTIASWQEVPLPRKRRKDAKAQPDPRQTSIEDDYHPVNKNFPWPSCSNIIPPPAMSTDEAMRAAVVIANAAVTPHPRDFSTGDPLTAADGAWQSDDPFRPTPGAPEFV